MSKDTSVDSMQNLRLNPNYSLARNNLGLLEVWRSQLIEARIYKSENEIGDAPNEIEIAIADIETVMAKVEEREGILDTQPTLQQKPHRSKIKEDHSNQMRLF